eukprot:4858785-Karenia_brevis.AAC.1
MRYVLQLWRCFNVLEKLRWMSFPTWPYLASGPKMASGPLNLILQESSTWGQDGPKTFHFAAQKHPI